jgi:hypothetical protein
MFSFLRAEIFDPKDIKSFYSCKFFSIFGHQNPGFGTESGSALN